MESKVCITTTDNNYDENKPLKWLSKIDDDTNEEFIEKFDKHQLSVETFDHRTLLRIIWTCLKNYGRKETVKAIFDHLKIYIRDLNETLIYFWIQIVHYELATTKSSTNDFRDFLLMNPQLLNEIALPLSYYKKDTLFSNQAKTTIILPDLKHLPNILPTPFASAINTIEKNVNAANEQQVNELDDDKFLRQFESYTLTSWSDRAHLRIWLGFT
ncbi:unnamed protein product [Rotaria sp. Silwood2]|nr:unnamed protein product [Rotaria sp. Silwood2]CAF2579371.1 unnamed protein product [Rotaria sp. Silwood2]CAF2826407.1 unnamed protein product [Rotaria sp. Silwood2]CAF3353725.1 unnamed protein product [Rotaria sp. Silwood2]CAF3908026.1 unnamed protein product [Rotaria sp. Silwood2]